MSYLTGAARFYRLTGYLPPVLRTGYPPDNTRVKDRDLARADSPPYVKRTVLTRACIVYLGGIGSGTASVE